MTGILMPVRIYGGCVSFNINHRKLSDHLTLLEWMQRDAVIRQIAKRWVSRQCSKRHGEFVVWTGSG